MAFWQDFLRGTRPGMLVALTTMPFGILYGVLAVDNGLSVTDALLMSVIVYGGASQMVGIDLFGSNVAPWLIVVSIFAVNFRHVLYSAGLGRRLGHWQPWQRATGFFLLTDPQFAECEARRERGEPLSFAWYLGLALPMYAMWNIDTLLGAMFGTLISDTHALGFDFMLSIYFFCLVMAFRRRALWVPVVGVSAIVSVIAHHIIGSPWHITAGAVAGVMLAALLTPSDARTPAQERA